MEPFIVLGIMSIIVSLIIILYFVFIKEKLGQGWNSILSGAFLGVLYFIVFFLLNYCLAKILGKDAAFFMGENAFYILAAFYPFTAKGWVRSLLVIVIISFITLEEVVDNDMSKKYVLFYFKALQGLIVINLSTILVMLLSKIKLPKMNFINKKTSQDISIIKRFSIQGLLNLVDALKTAFNYDETTKIKIIVLALYMKFAIPLKLTSQEDDIIKDVIDTILEYNDAAFLELLAFIDLCQKEHLKINTSNKDNTAKTFSIVSLYTQYLFPNREKYDLTAETITLTSMLGDIAVIADALKK